MNSRILTIVATALLAACGGEEGAGRSTAQPSGNVPAVADTAGVMPRAGLIYELPAGWQRVPPESQMRLDQAKIPGPGGEADLAVFFFGAQGGGGVEDNLNRWAAQIEGAGPQRDTFTSEDLRISTIDASGTLKASTMGTGPATPQPDSRLLGAVIEGAGGPWFFKVTGPQQTVSEQREAFLQMLRNAKLAPRT
jgi:hypothetical protein